MQLAHVHDVSAHAVAAAQQQTTLDGQVTYRRRLSSKLVFYDVLQAGTEDSWWEVVVKVGDEAFGSIQAVKDLRDSLKLGDTVRVTGWREAPAGHPALRATSIQVTQPWRQQHPDTGFIPQPAPKVHHHQPQHAHTPQQQQTPALQAQQLGRSTAQQQQQHADSTQSAGDPSCIPAAEGVDTASGIAAASTDGPAAQAARVTGPQVSVCKFWVNTGRCAKGAQCPFLHTLLPAAGGVSRKTWVQKRELERQQRAADKGFVHNSSAAAKRKRARVFAAWLVQQYGKERLSAGSGVLDVAGGRGALTCELAYVHGIKCTLIDPRPLKLNKLHHRQLQQAGRTAAVRTYTLEQLQQGRVGSAAVMYEQEQLQSGSSSDYSLVQQEHKQSLQQQAVTDTIQQQQQQQQQHARPIQTAAAPCMSLQPDSQTISQNEAQGSACLSQSVLGADALQRSIQQQQQQQQQPAPGSFDTAVQLFQVQAWFGSELWNTPGWQQLFKDCSLVVGLHPDQATEPILDFAVQQQLPFAVVPCCVFPRLFPQRQLQQGDGSFAHVVAYDELVEYLVQRGSANKGVLDFEGANTVVYRL